jgi:hypothetical protein
MQTQDPNRIRKDDVAAKGPSLTMREDHRSSEEKTRDMAILADIYYRHPNLDHYAIADKYNEITGLTLERREVSAEINTIKRMAVTEMIEDMKLVVAEELIRIDAMEKAYWNLFYESQDEVKKQIIDAALVENEDGDMEEVVKNIRTIKEFQNDFGRRILNDISELQKERRKLVGAYAPSKIVRDVNVDVKLKGYSVVSPDDWD